MRKKAGHREGFDRVRVPGHGGSMNNANHRDLVLDQREQAREQLTPTETTYDASQRPRLVACLLLVPSDAEPILTLLVQLAPSFQVPIPLPFFSSSRNQNPTPTQDPSLQHAVA